MSTDSTDSGTAAATTAASTPAAAPAVAASPQITLHQFALEVSGRDKRVALLHGFLHGEQTARRFKDTEANYEARYLEFANKPV